MEDYAIKVENVSKSFRLPHEKRSSVKSMFVNIFRGSRTYEEHRVINDFSFEVKHGEFFGVVGRNGSGKSTLLKLLAEIYTPDEGKITINGKLTPFIELGVGFNPELTGRENVYLNGALLGFSRKQMDEMYDRIVSFAELEAFMDQKLKNYSSGMQVRLAFSIAIRAETEILLIDEVLAVGDVLFQKKCYSYFKELKKNKKTVIFISHDTAALQEYCDRGILINKGEIIKEGKIEEVTRDYLDLLNKIEEEAKAKEKNKESERWGTGAMAVTGLSVLGPDKKPREVFTSKNESITVRAKFQSKANIEEPVYGISIIDSSGAKIFQSNTLWLKQPTKDMKPNETTEVEWIIPNFFNSGTFYISPAVADKAGSVIYDWREEMGSFTMNKEIPTSGFVNIEHELKILSR